MLIIIKKIESIGTWEDRYRETDIEGFKWTNRVVYKKLNVRKKHFMPLEFLVPTNATQEKAR